MAENPADWNRAEKIISETIHDHEEARAAGMVGFTIVKRIANALRAAGYKIEDEDHT